MLSEEIRSARQSKGMTQEELATRLGVVRQTVSKWEKGLSVPDADLLVSLADVLEVPVEQLLSLEEGHRGPASEKTAAEALDREQRREQADNRQRLILFLCFAALLLSRWEGLGVLPMLAAAGCLIASVFLLRRGLPLLAMPGTAKKGAGALRTAGVVNIAIIAAAAAVTLLDRASYPGMPQEQERMLARGFLAAVMLFAGWISPRFPRNRYTGLRLPWTVRDEETWQVAHRSMAVVSPLAALGYLTIPPDAAGFEALSTAVILLWIGIPAILSLVFYRRKTAPRQ